MTAYELRISDWSSDVCSSDLGCSTDCRSRRPRAPPPPGRPRHGCRYSRRRRSEEFSNPHLCHVQSRPPNSRFGGSCKEGDQGVRKRVVSGREVDVRGELGRRRFRKKKKTMSQHYKKSY